MTLEEIKRIAAARTRGNPTIEADNIKRLLLKAADYDLLLEEQIQRDSEFIASAFNNIDALIAVAEAAREAMQIMEEDLNYVPDSLSQSLEALK